MPKAQTDASGRFVAAFTIWTKKEIFFVEKRKNLLQNEKAESIILLFS